MQSDSRPTGGKSGSKRQHARIVTPVVTVTRFNNRFASEMRSDEMTYAGLVAQLRDPPTLPRKDDLPYLKLAAFDGSKTDKGCYRHDDGVLCVYGVEGDHDKGTATIEEAAEKLAAAGIAAILYDSPSATPEKHKWRVLCLLSQPVSGGKQDMHDRRAELVSQLQGALGRAVPLDPVSWTLSQSFIFGRVEGTPERRVIEVPGQFLDLVTEIAPLPKPKANGAFPADAPPKLNGKAKSPTQEAFFKHLRPVGIDLRACIESAINGETFHVALRDAAAHLAGKQVPAEAIIATMMSVRDASAAADPKHPRHERWKALPKEIRKLAESAAEKYHEAQVEACDLGEPVDLFAPVVAPDMQPGMVPDLIYQWAEAQGRLMGVDTGSLAMMALATCAGLLTDAAQIQIKRADPQWLESARLWYGMVGDPSVKKSPALKKATSTAWAINSGQMKENMFRLMQWKLACAAAKKANEPFPDKPPMKRAVTDDFTIEALSNILADNPEGVLQVKNELADFFASIHRYNATGKGAGEAARYLELYDGGPKMVDRVTRGEVFVPNWSAGLLGGIQPETLRKVIANLPHDGLLQRFLLTMGKARPSVEVEVPEKLLDGYDSLCLSIFETRRSLVFADTMKKGGMVVRLGPEAEDVRRRVFDRLDGLVEALASNGHIASHIGKWHGVYARLLLTVHWIECALLHGPSGRPTEGGDWGRVSGETAEMVERLMFDYLLPHLFAFYEAVADEDAGDIRGQTYDDVQKIAQFILVKGLQSFTPGELTSLVKRWRFRDFRERERVLSALEHMHWIIPAPEEGGGRGRPAHSRWDVNPLVHERFSEARGRFAATMAAVTMGAGRRSKGN